MDEKARQARAYLMQFVPKGFDERLYVESQGYDKGHRDALSTQLKALLEAAQRQAKRSGETASNKLAGDYDRQLAAQDAEIARLLGLAYDEASK